MFCCKVLSVCLLVTTFCYTLLVSYISLRTYIDTRSSELSNLTSNVTFPSIYVLSFNDSCFTQFSVKHGVITAWSKDNNLPLISNRGIDVDLLVDLGVTYVEDHCGLITSLPLSFRPSYRTVCYTPILTIFLYSLAWLLMFLRVGRGNYQTL